MIKVSYLVSYDYEMFHVSVKLIYDYVDKIVLAIDKDNKTWTGNDFTIPNSFYEKVKKNDPDNKIVFYKDSFYNKDLTPMENETIERNKVLTKLGYGWKIQLDVDEYIYDFKTIATYLNKYSFLCFFPRITPVNLKGKLITLFKKVEDGYVFIDNGETYAFITNQNKNKFGRSNASISNIQTNISVIHQSWARSDHEILQKINNWGHKNDFDTMKYFSLWESINGSNYKKYKNIHPLNPSVWKELLFIPSNSIEDFILKYKTDNPQRINSLKINRFIKALMNRIKW